MRGGVGAECGGLSRRATPLHLAPLRRGGCDCAEIAPSERHTFVQIAHIRDSGLLQPSRHLVWYFPHGQNFWYSWIISAPRKGFASLQKCPHILQAMTSLLLGLASCA